MEKFEILSLTAFGSFLEKLAKRHECHIVGGQSGVNLHKDIFIKSDYNVPMFILRDLASFILDFKKSIFGSLLKDDFSLCIARENEEYKGKNWLERMYISPMVVEKNLGYNPFPDGDRVRDFAAVLPAKYLLSKDIVIEEEWIRYAKTYAKNGWGYLDVWDIHRDLLKVLDEVSKYYGKDYNKRYEIWILQQKLGIEYMIYCREDNEGYEEFAYYWNRWLSFAASCTDSRSSYAYLCNTLLVPHKGLDPTHYMEFEDEYEGANKSYYDWCCLSNYHCSGFVAIHPSLW